MTFFPQRLILKVRIHPCFLPVPSLTPHPHPLPTFAKCANVEIIKLQHAAHLAIGELIVEILLVKLRCEKRPEGTRKGQDWKIPLDTLLFSLMYFCDCPACRYLSGQTCAVVKIKAAFPM